MPATRLSETTPRRESWTGHYERDADRLLVRHGLQDPAVLAPCKAVVRGFDADGDPELEIVVLNGHGKLRASLAVGPVELLDLRRAR